MFHSFQHTSLAHILLGDIFTFSAHSDDKNILVKKDREIKDVMLFQPKKTLDMARVDIFLRWVVRAFATSVVCPTCLLLGGIKPEAGAVRVDCSCHTASDSVMLSPAVLIELYLCRYLPTHPITMIGLVVFLLEPRHASETQSWEPG